ncbi:unnamed protein product [Trifolium pratense]|uniref:Uncharacterized protein n=1 Tax=Trifolium pratense TaxID=57577 RepID=A0ACB0LKL2_TRIPR|nr:unnamed protein product [Trifolium pratense]
MENGLQYWFQHGKQNKILQLKINITTLGSLVLLEFLLQRIEQCCLLHHKVWRRLEEQNPEFFRSYYTSLAVMKQIEEYNRLLEKQKQLMDEEQTKVASTSNGFHSHAVSSLLPYSNIPDFMENPYVYAPQTTEGLINVGMADMFAQGDIPTMPHIQNSNDRSSSSSGMVDMSIHEVNINEASPNVGNYASATPITSAYSTLHSMNESVADRPYTYLNESLSRAFSFQNMLSEYHFQDIPGPECSTSSPHMFGSDVNVNEASPNVGNYASATPITSAKSTLHSMNEYTYLNESLSRAFSFQNMLSEYHFQDIPVPECSSSSPHMFGSDVNVNDASPNVGNAITSANSTLHSVNESVAEDRPYTYLNESISRAFSFENMLDMFSDVPDRGFLVDSNIHDFDLQ